MWNYFPHFILKPKLVSKKEMKVTTPVGYFIIPLSPC